MPCWMLNTYPVLENDQNLIDSYLSRAGVSRSVQNGGVWWLAGESVKRHRLLYCKEAEGDCGTKTPPDLGAAKAASVAGTALGGATAVGGTGALLGALGLSGGLAGAATAGLALIPTLLIGIFAHHAQAVAQEQMVLCDVSTKYNAYAQAIEQAISSGQFTLEQAQALSAGVAQQLQQELSEGYKDCNAYCYYKSSLAATELFAREVVYPRLAQPTLSNIANTITQPGNLALLAAGAVGVKLLFF